MILPCQSPAQKALLKKPPPAPAAAADIVDTRTLITLLHLRDIGDQFGHPCSIVTEMLDVCNRALAQITRADDFIVSDELASLLMTQISENKELSLVFEDLFFAEGSEIYI